MCDWAGGGDWGIRWWWFVLQLENWQFTCGWRGQKSGYALSGHRTFDSNGLSDRSMVKFVLSSSLTLLVVCFIIDGWVLRMSLLVSGRFSRAVPWAVSLILAV